jgi:hypothetical protein
LVGLVYASRVEAAARGKNLVFGRAPPKVDFIQVVARALHERHQVKLEETQCIFKRPQLASHLLPL